MKKQNWNLLVFILSFALAVIFSFLTNILSNNSDIMPPLEMQHIPAMLHTDPLC